MRAAALLVDRFQPEEIARAIRRSLEYPEEAQKRAQLAKQYVQRWTIAAMAEQYERVYRDILDRKSQKLNRIK